MNDSLKCEPIGYFHGCHKEKYMVPRQAELGIENEKDRIILKPGFNFEQALEDLKGFGHIWLIYWFHRNESWKPKVTTPREGPKRGLFATRSPHRPNPIGLSCVPLLDIQGREIYIGKNDLLTETPILDIKPYLVYADAFSNSKQGWIEEGAPKNLYVVQWSSLAQNQAAFIESQQQQNLIDTANLRLKDNPYPFKNHRIKKIEENLYELALKTWRLVYSINHSIVNIHKITSGYDRETLTEEKSSPWNDVSLHQEFLTKFPL